MSSALLHSMARRGINRRQFRILYGQGGAIWSRLRRIFDAMPHMAPISNRRFSLRRRARLGIEACPINASMMGRRR